ncbi:MAG: nickel-dependent hydrogenase large subunit [Candidatus Riflebacteria bacterium]|nr:nickel-dependent hydrogenase large subunit [Candidatus Riflebacteria bacterium]
MSQRVTIEVPVNRVEGDLEIRVELEGGVVSNAWCSGTMYRGFERILVGRGAMDGLVVTPRVCGICSTAHLMAASRALDMIVHAEPPPDATRMRNVTLMTEHIQSDMRHAFLMFAVDFVNPIYKARPLFAEAVRRYEPFKGQTVLEVIRETKKVLEIVAIIGGQWPHSSYMVPGGIVSVPGRGDLRQCRLLLKQYRDWYERRVLGCSLSRWLDVRRASDLDVWLEESDAHRESELGFFIRFAREIGLDGIGKGHGNFVSYGSFELPEGTQVRGPRRDGLLVPAGFAQGTRVRPFDQMKIVEHTDYSWYKPSEGGKHPEEGETEPYATGHEGKRYSWAKAPRYEGAPAETGPLAEMIVAGSPLFADLVNRGGSSVLVRELARLTRPCELIPAMEMWLTEAVGDGTYYKAPTEIATGEGYGLTEAARGALGHWVRIRNGFIEHYQIITPTAWHASPRDASGVRGTTEEALVGTAVADPANPVELGHVVRSFDHCLVCTVHTIRRGRELGRITVGGA